MSQKQKWLSRTIFYGGAITLLWALGKMSPTSAEIAAQRDEAIGASSVVILFPDSVEESAKTPPHEKTPK